MASALKQLTIDEMVTEIKRRKKLLDRLHRQRAALLGKLAALDREIEKAGGQAVGSPLKSRISGVGSRFKNKQSLVEAMIAAMSKEKAMSVGEIEKAVVRNGYRSSSSTFKTIIFQVLGRDKRFKKSARGLYLLK